MERGKLLNEVFRTNSLHYTDYGKYISKKMRNRMKKQAGDIFYRSSPDAFKGQVWKSKLGRKFINKK